MNLSFSNDEEFKTKLTEIVLSNLSVENFGVEQLVEQSGISLTVIRHRLKKISKKTISQFINEVRLQKALEMLQQSNTTASEVAFKVGFSSPTYFNNCFHDYFGYPPGEAKKRKLEKTESNQLISETGQTKEESKRHSLSLKKVILVSGITIFILIITGFLFYPSFLNRLTGKPILLNNQEKSIAVLPFINDCPDSSNVYIINGMMDAITEKLSKIEDLRVASRTSAEYYRDNKTKKLPQIARELNVNYIVEGSIQKDENRIKLSVRLIDARNDKYLFVKQYEQNLNNFFSIQSEVALDVANEIKAKITPEEKEMIETPLTKNLEAMFYYEKGRELRYKAQTEDNKELYQQAKIYFDKALQLDSMFVEAYVHIAWIFGATDTSLYLLNKALRINNKSSFAYFTKGYGYFMMGFINDAEENFRLALKYNPNYSSPNKVLGQIYFLKGDFSKAIDLENKALMNDTTEYNSWNYEHHIRRACLDLYSIGFVEEGKQLAEKLVRQSNDSVYYLKGMVAEHFYSGDFESAKRVAQRIDFWERTSIDQYSPGNACLFTKDYKCALDYAEKLEGIVHQKGFKISRVPYIGFTYLKNGKQMDADRHFNRLIEDNMKFIEINQPLSTWLAQLDLLYIYSARGEKAKALEYLRKVKENKDYKIPLYSIVEFKYHPVYDIIRNEPEFQEFISDMEAKFEIERVKVEKILRSKEL